MVAGYINGSTGTSTCSSQICKSWILSLTWIQRIHLMHFCESLISGNSLSQRNSSRRCLNGTSMMFRSLARLCRVQLPLLTQVAHLQSCWEKDQLYSLSSGCTNLWAVCMDYHYLLLLRCCRKLPVVPFPQVQQRRHDRLRSR